MTHAGQSETTTTAPLVAIVGPTASGKSALGVWLAEQLNGEVVACDSTQVYRYFDIGTAKPGIEERRGIAHHLLDLLDPEEIFTAGDYRRRAGVVLDDLRRRGKLPILTVGTGLYLRALLEGLSDAPARSEELRARLSERARVHRAGYLHRLLKRLDPAAARRIAQRDHPKLIRAIEVCLLTGRPMSELHRSGRAGLVGFRAVKVGLMPPRAALYRRIHQRVEMMLEQGWLGEVKNLAAQGIPAEAKPFHFIGYGELRGHLAGELDLEQAIAAIQQTTRRYAKRQITWFRREAGVHWFEGFGDAPEIRAQVLAHVEKQVATEREFRARHAPSV